MYHSSNTATQVWVTVAAALHHNSSVQLERSLRVSGHGSTILAGCGQSQTSSFTRYWNFTCTCIAAGVLLAV